MAAIDVCVKVEPNRDTERALEALDVSEMKLKIDKCEVNTGEEDGLQENEFITVPREKPVYKCNSMSVFECRQSNAYFRSRARLMRTGHSVNMIIDSTRSLLEDYCLMSQCRHSLYCSQVQCSPTVVTCTNCGKHFIGRGDRVLKLRNHIEFKHSLIAEKLILDMIKRYGALLERMGKFLHMDRHLIASHFD